MWNQNRKNTYKNGQEISREILSQDIITPAKNKIVAKRTMFKITIQGLVFLAIIFNRPFQTLFQVRLYL